MPLPVIRGSLANFRRRREVSFDPARGWDLHETYQGLSDANIQALADSYEAAGIAYRSMLTDDVFTLESQDATNEFVVDNWQIAQNELQLSSLENPFNLANISEVDLDTIASAIDGQDESSALPAAQANPFGDRLYKRLLKGGTHFVSSQYVLRHTTNVSNRWSANISDFNVDRIYTVAQLLSEVQSGVLWTFPLPARLAYKIQALVFPAVRAFYQNGWLKRGSTEQTSAHNRVDIVTEYWMGQWTTDEYAYAT